MALYSHILNRKNIITQTPPDTPTPAWGIGYQVGVKLSSAFLCFLVFGFLMVFDGFFV